MNDMYTQINEPFNTIIEAKCDNYVNTIFENHMNNVPHTDLFMSPLPTPAAIQYQHNPPRYSDLEMRTEVLKTSGIDMNMMGQTLLETMPFSYVMRGFKKKTREHPMSERPKSSSWFATELNLETT